MRLYLLATLILFHCLTLVQCFVSLPTENSKLYRSYFTSFATKDNFHHESKSNNTSLSTRRNLLKKSLWTIPFFHLSTAQKSNALLVQFPCKEGSLMNTYSVMRAGESLFEEKNIWETNPLFLTNRDDALSLRGMEQVRYKCKELAMTMPPTLVIFSIAAKCADSADIISNELKITRNRVLPEYSYLDPRGVGLWNTLPYNTTEEAVWALDVQYAGVSGLGENSKPPPNEDGTAHETLAEQAVRLRQLISVQESARAGENILLIFPDGLGPALLTCLISGIPLNRVHEFELKPGEVRYNVTYNKGQLLAQQTPSSEYLAKIDSGNRQLEYLLSSTNDIIAEREDKFLQTLPSLTKTTTTTADSVTISKSSTAFKSRMNTNDESDDDDLTKLAIPAVVLALGGAVALQNNELENDAEKNMPPTLIHNGTIEDKQLDYTNNTSNDFIDINAKPGLSLFDSDEENYEDFYTNSQDVVKEKEQLAIDAMEEYMNRDDGSDDWLSSIQSIMMEEDVVNKEENFELIYTSSSSLDEDSNVKNSSLSIDNKDLGSFQ